MQLMRRLISIWPWRKRTTTTPRRRRWRFILWACVGLATIIGALPSGREFALSLVNGDFFLGRLEVRSGAPPPLFQSFDIAASRRLTPRRVTAPGENEGPTFLDRVERMRWSVSATRRRAAALLFQTSTRRDGLVLLRSRANNYNDWMELAELAKPVFLPIAFEAYRQAYLAAPSDEAHREACFASGLLRRNDLSQAPIAPCATGRGLLSALLSELFSQAVWTDTIVDAIAATPSGQTMLREYEEGFDVNFLELVLGPDAASDRDIRAVLAALEPHHRGVQSVYERFARERARWLARMPPEQSLFDRILAAPPTTTPALSPAEEIEIAQTQARATRELLVGLCRTIRASNDRNRLCARLLELTSSYERYLVPATAAQFVVVAERDVGSVDSSRLAVIADLAYVWRVTLDENPAADTAQLRVQLDHVMSRASARELSVAQQTGDIGAVLDALEDLADEREDVGQINSAVAWLSDAAALAAGLPDPARHLESLEAMLEAQDDARNIRSLSDEAAIAGIDPRLPILQQMLSSARQWGSVRKQIEIFEDISGVFADLDDRENQRHFLAEAISLAALEGDIREESRLRLQLAILTISETPDAAAEEARMASELAKEIEDQWLLSAGTVVSAAPTYWEGHAPRACTMMSRAGDMLQLSAEQANDVRGYFTGTNFLGTFYFSRFGRAPSSEDTLPSQEALRQIFGDANCEALRQSSPIRFTGSTLFGIHGPPLARPRAEQCAVVQARRLEPSGEAPATIAGAVAQVCRFRDQDRGLYAPLVERAVIEVRAARERRARFASEPSHSD